jgi:hypothetical protein
MASEGADCAEALTYAELGLAAARKAQQANGQDVTRLNHPLLQLARARMGCGLQDAEPLVDEAIENALELTELRPDLRAGHLALGHAWQIRMEFATSPEARADARQHAVAAFRAVLEVAPGYVAAQHALTGLAESQPRTS